MRSNARIVTVRIVKRIAVVLGLLVGMVAGGVSCDAPTFWCLDDLVVGDGEWTCHCKVGAVECADVGACLAECPLP